jgi:hypothetical protein
MNLQLNRFSDGKKSTGGILLVEDDFFGFTCEDEFRKVKVFGETRIPRGTYQILLRDEGGMTVKYRKRFPFHKGMLHLQNVPNFEWIYIHVGNNEKQTAGCILFGYSANCVNGEITLGRSEEAYRDLYELILLALEREKVWIAIN